MLKGRNKKNEKPANGEVKETGSEANQLPLFFKQPHVLQSDRHKKAGVRQDKGMGFAKKTNSIIVTTAEFVEAAKYYPIVFTTGDVVTPAVMVGLEQDNYYVDAKGAWKEGIYIPAYARQYPFVFVEVPNSDQLTLCIDEGADAYTDNAKEENTTKLFEKDGKPTAFTNSALEFCSAVQQQHVFTQGFCKTLKDLDLLAPQEMEAKLESGTVIRMAGFQCIDQEKLRNLPEAKISELHKNGFLPLCYFAVLSMTNWPRLLQLAEKAKAS